MKIRKVRIGIKDLKTALNEFVEIDKAVEQEMPVKQEKGVYFTSIEAFRKALTPPRLALLRTIKTKKPLSVSHLSEMMDRDVSKDIRFLEQVGLVDVKKDEKIRKEIKPFVGYDRILFEIAV